MVTRKNIYKGRENWFGEKGQPERKEWGRGRRKKEEWGKRELKREREGEGKGEGEGEDAGEGEDESEEAGKKKKRERGENREREGGRMKSRKGKFVLQALGDPPPPSAIKVGKIIGLMLGAAGTLLGPVRGCAVAVALLCRCCGVALPWGDMQAVSGCGLLW